MLVITGLPILALTTLLGGIAPAAVLAVFAITLSTAVAVSALAVCVSVFARRARDAVTRAYVFLAGLLILPPLTYAWLYWPPGQVRWLRWAEPIVDQFMAANPVVVLGQVMGGLSADPMGESWRVLGHLVANHAVFAVLLVALAVAMVRRVHLCREGKAARRIRRRPLLFRPAIGNRPALWKEVFIEASTARLGSVGWLVLGAFLVLFVVLTIYQFLESLQPSYSPFVDSFTWFVTWMGTLVGSILLLLILARAAAGITGEKERDTWNALMSTPLTGNEILVAKMLGSIWAVRIGLGMLLFLWFLLVVLNPLAMIAVAFTAGTLALLSLVAAGIGVHCSLRCATSVRAMGLALGIGLLVGGGYLFCCVPAFIMPGSELILAPVVPFLLAFPMIILAEGSLPGAEGVLAAYTVGLIGYGAAAFVLWIAGTASFDRAAGRLDGNMGPERGRRASTEAAPLPAERIAAPPQSPFATPPPPTKPSPP